MTPTEINIAIAEACGWKCCDKDGNWKDANGKYGVNGCPPRYFHDLNACAEMEELIITLGKWREYADALARTCRGYIGSIHATAPQRCEAFLRVRGKLKE